MSNASVCVTDLDCPVSKVCYSVSDETFCDCITIYGWTGEECNGFRGEYWIFFLVDLAALLYALRVLRQVYLTLRPLRKERKLRGWFLQLGGMTSLWIFFFTSLYFVAYILFQAVLGLEAVLRDQFKAEANVELIPGYDKRSTLTPYSALLIALQVLCIIASLLNLSLHWSEMAHDQRRTTISGRGFDRSEVLGKRTPFRVFVYMVEIVSVVVTIIVFVKKKYDVLVTLSMVSASILFVTVTASGLWYRNSLKSSGKQVNMTSVSESERMSELVGKAIIRTLPFALCILVALGYLLHLFSKDIKALSLPGKISPLTWALHAVTLSTYCVAVSVFHYINSIVLKQLDAVRRLVPSSAVSTT
mmetsp:Transcript_5150/g.6735  ORF Transcript_5150/g.6735 Transcript_5150/m.6735 type:complete len:360 (+) Transcript_5150:301-1380(+)